jgi:hypothetical protein
MLIYFSFDDKDTVCVSKISKIAKKLEESKIICWPPAIDIALIVGKDNHEDEVDDETIDENDTDDDEMIIDQLAASESQDESHLISVPVDIDSISDIAIEKLNSSSIVLMFLSENYQTAINSSKSPLNSCRYEFLTAFSKTKPIIPIVIDEHMKSPKNWQSRVAVALTDYLYFDLSDERLYESTDDLFSKKARLIMNCILQVAEGSSVKAEVQPSSNINEVIGSQLVITSAVPSSSILSEYCPIHHYQHRYTLYDQDCHLPLCILCYHSSSSSHRSHRICNILDLKEEYGEERHGKSISFMNEYLSQLDEQQKKNEQIVNDYSLKKYSALVSISEVFDEIEQSLEDRYLQYKESIENEYQERITVLTEQKSLCQGIKMSLSGLTTETELLFNHYSHIKGQGIGENIENNEIRYILSALKLEQEIHKIQEKKPPFDSMIPSSEFASSLHYNIQESEVLSFKERIHSFGTLKDEKDHQLSLLQKHSELLKSLSELLQLPSEVKIHYNVDYPVVLQSMLEEGCSASSFFEIVYISYLEEFINWLKEELVSSVPSSSLSLYCLQILFSSHYSIAVSPLLSSNVSKTIRNIEFSFAANGEFMLNYKRFSSQLLLGKGELTDLLPQALFPLSRILFGNPTLVFPLVEMVKEIQSLNIMNATRTKAPFQLMYQGTRDGMTIASFRKAVSSHRNLLVIMKCLDGNIFGAFTSIGFDSSSQTQRKDDTVLEILSPGRKRDQLVANKNEMTSDILYRRDSQAFLFSLKNPIYFSSAPNSPILTSSSAVSTATSRPIKFPISPSHANYALQVPHNNEYGEISEEFGFIFGENYEMILDKNFLVYFQDFVSFLNPTSYNHIIFTGKYTGNSLIEMEVWKLST